MRSPGRWLDLALLFAGSYCLLAGSYASLIPHSIWIPSSILALRGFSTALTLGTGALRLNDERAERPPTPFDYPVRKRKEDLYVPQIIVLFE